jgi:cellulose synthase/poly-beta-1,6-N-acetylglucosamine synthase-like glycosyltransferase
MNKQLSVKKHPLALIIPGHNEELVIEQTIKSAIQAGLSATHIYVVDDNSSDQTAEIARKILGKNHVLTVSRSGKALAIKKAIKAFRIKSRYVWLHIADADSAFEDKYFIILKKELNPEKYVAAAGYVKSMYGGWISKYRAYEYTFGQEVMRRIQHMLGVIPVIPGPTSCFRTDILKHLDFETHNLTEDFDITIQIHRKKLGKIAFISNARTLTQDPKDYGDYVKQITRWYRGFWQGVSTYKIGLGWQRIDAYLGYQIFEMFAYYFNLLILLPLLLLGGRGALVIAQTFLLDVSIFFVMTLMACITHRRLDIIGAFPLFYLLRITNMVLYVKAFFEVIVLRRFRGASIGWSTANRRYKVSEA